MMLALGLVLPFLTGQIQQIGNMLLPMHIPVLLTGFVCGPIYGAVIGFSLPLLRSAFFSMPPFFPTATAMAFELLTYGLVSGLIYTLVKKHNLFTVYLSLISAMILGRLVWGLVQLIQLSVTASGLTFTAFISSALLNAIPGIVLQLILIPVVIGLLERYKLVLPSKISRNHESN